MSADASLWRSLAGMAASAALVYLALGLALMVFQRSLIYHPQPRALGDAGASLTLEVAATGDVPGARLQITARPREGAKALVYLGGNAEDVSLNLPAFARAFPDHAIYLLHYRGFGASSGKPSEAALHADALALFDWVQARHAQTAVVGRSLGTGVAVRLARLRPVASLVLVTPYDSLQDIAASTMPLFPVRWMLFDKFESWRDAPSVSAPTLLIAAEHDEVIANASTERLLTRFRPGVATLKRLAGTGHNSIDASSGYLAAMAAALDAAI